jgi:hypothetical protein
MSHPLCCTSFWRPTLVAALTTLTGFTLHVLDVDYLRNWLFDTPAGPRYSPAITALAALTSIENGMGMVVFYALVRGKLGRHSLPLRAGLLALILLAIKGTLFRNLIMELALAGFGVQTLFNMVPWIIGLGMSFVLVYSYEHLIGSKSCEAPAYP